MGDFLDTKIRPCLASMRNGRTAIGARLHAGTIRILRRVNAKLECERGQGTTEYAILVGVLVVIAILAIMLFKDKLAALWEAISSGINGL